MKRIRLFLTVVVVLVAATALAACGESTVDNGDVEEQAQVYFDEVAKAQGGESVSEIDCEDDLKAEKGESVNCTATGPDGELKFTASVASVDDDTAQLEFKPTE